MNIQIFGTTKCFDTKKAQRYFKERGIRFQMIDLKEKEMSRGEFENVSRALGGWQALVSSSRTSSCSAPPSSAMAVRPLSATSPTSGRTGNERLSPK